MPPGTQVRPDDHAEWRACSQRTNSGALDRLHVGAVRSRCTSATRCGNTPAWASRDVPASPTSSRSTVRCGSNRLATAGWPSRVGPASSTSCSRSHQRRGRLVRGRRLRVIARALRRAFRSCPMVWTSSVLGDHARRDGFTVGFVGSLKPWHGVDTLLAAAERIAPVIRGLRVLIVGDGPERTRFGRWQGRRPGGRVVFAGAVPKHEVPRACRDGRRDGALPTARRLLLLAAEALRLHGVRRAIVASRIGQITDVLTDGTDALLAAPGDADDLARRLMECHQDPALAADWRGSARLRLPMARVGTAGDGDSRRASSRRGMRRALLEATDARRHLDRGERHTQGAFGVWRPLLPYLRPFRGAPGRRLSPDAGERRAGSAEALAAQVDHRRGRAVAPERIAVGLTAGGDPSMLLAIACGAILASATLGGVVETTSRRSCSPRPVSGP